MRLKLLGCLIGAGLACLLLAFVLLPDPDPDPVGPKQAYTEWRYVGFQRKGGTCPQVDGWKSAHLLADALEELENNPDPKEKKADRTLFRKLGLDRFCVYTRTSGNQDFVRPAGLVAAQKDRALAATALNQMVPVLSDRFHHQTGRDLTSSLSPGNPTVRLTLIDSQPKAERVSNQPPLGSQHGYTLAHLAQQLVCHGPCAAKVTTNRALHYSNLLTSQTLAPPAVGADQGGHVGLVSDLSRAIMEEVLKWRNEDSKHLILNISLGWDGELFGDFDSRKLSALDPSVQAVYRALQFARHEGVLVVAAAGNRRGGPVRSTLPLLPAAWELEGPWSLSLGLHRKLVYSVGGVDWQGLPLPNYRHGGLPRRVAYGDHAATMVAGQPTAIYTGTSVSAAVVSSIAAVVWHLRPELRPDQVMDLIDDSGKDLDAKADFYHRRSKGPAPRLRRISLCEAVKRACGPDGSECSALAAVPVCPPWPAETARLPWPTPDSRTRIEFPLPTGTPFSNQPCDPCTWFGPNAYSSPCPTDQYGGVTDQRWIFPQPDAVPCPGCALVPDPPNQFASLELGAQAADLPKESSYTLKLEISKMWRLLADVKSATLDIDCFDDDGALVERMTYPVSIPPSGNSLMLRGLRAGKPHQRCTAQLNFVVVKGGRTMSVQNPVVLDPGL